MKVQEAVVNGSKISDAKRTVLNILFAQQFVTENLAEIFKTYDLSTEQYNVLRILRGRKGAAANMCSIQESMIAKTSNTTRLVDKLLLKAYVTREICPQNRRKIEVYITQKGLDVLSELDPLVDSVEKSISKNLSSEELHQLNILLEKYRTA